MSFNPLLLCDEDTDSRKFRWQEVRGWHDSWSCEVVSSVVTLLPRLSCLSLSSTLPFFPFPYLFVAATSLIILSCLFLSLILSSFSLLYLHPPSIPSATSTCIVSASTSTVIWSSLNFFFLVHCSFFLFLASSSSLSHPSIHSLSYSNPLSLSILLPFLSLFLARVGKIANIPHVVAIAYIF